MVGEYCVCYGRITCAVLKMMRLRARSEKVMGILVFVCYGAEKDHHRCVEVNAIIKKHQRIRCIIIIRAI